MDHLAHPQIFARPVDGHIFVVHDQRRAWGHTKEHIKYGEENKTIADNGDNLRRTTRRQSPRSNSVLIKTSSDQMNLKFHFLTALQSQQEPLRVTENFWFGSSSW